MSACICRQMVTGEQCVADQRSGRAQYPGMSKAGCVLRHVQGGPDGRAARCLWQVLLPDGPPVRQPGRAHGGHAGLAAKGPQGRRCGHGAGLNVFSLFFCYSAGAILLDELHAAGCSMETLHGMHRGSMSLNLMHAAGCSMKSLHGMHRGSMSLNLMHPDVETVCVCSHAGMTGYILKATLSSTMGRAVPVTLPSLQQAVIAAAAKRPVSF